MDPRPDVIRAQIASTRATLDRHLDEFGAELDATKDRVAAKAQYWGAIAAIAAGLVGALVFWPRRARPRRVLHAIARAS